MTQLAMIVCSVLLLVVLKNRDAFSYVLNAPLAITQYGLVQGTTELSRHRREFFSFRGMPFAAPPVGDLRFKAPEEPPAWKGIRDGSKHQSYCVQSDYLFENNPLPKGAEDCLYINVYTPQLPSAEETIELLPVMALIPYGGFFQGYGDDDIWGPEYIMDKNVVLVTFNYRMGVFGFLSTLDNASPGNYGLKDQVLALKWIQNNIINFGGDNRRVTIVGQSAGGGSVHHHILSEASKGLFHQAISQSGSVLNLWAIPKNELSLQVAKFQAQFVGCDSNGTSFEMVDCLKKVDAYKLMKSGDMFKYFDIEPITPYGPVIETKTDANPEPFITQGPLEVIEQKKFNNVPWITGAVSGEGILRTSAILRNATSVKTLNENIKKFGPMIMGLSISLPEEKVTPTWKAIVDLYLEREEIDVNNPKSVQGFTDLVSDRAFLHGVYMSALGHAVNGHQNIWFYNFDYRGAETYGDKFSRTDEDINFNWGTSHCDDLIYMFRSPRFFQQDLQGSDYIMSEIMVEMWTNFVIYGHPTPYFLNTGNVGLQWDPIRPILKSKASNEDLNFLNISGRFGESISIGMTTGYYPERMGFWSRLGLLEAFKNLE